MAPAQQWSLRHYQTFDPSPALEGILDLDIKDNKPHVIGFNGPPGSGKSWLAAKLQKLIGRNCGIVRPSSYLYGMMRSCGLPDTHLPYEDFKNLPGGRQRLIAAAKVFRDYNCDVFSIQTMATETWANSDVVLVDNIGFEDELDFYSQNSRSFAMLTIMMPRNLLPQNDTVGASRDEIIKRAKARDEYNAIVATGGQWPGDSRFCLLNTPAVGNVYHAAFISSQFAYEYLSQPILDIERFAGRNGMNQSTRGVVVKMFYDAQDGMDDLFANRIQAEKV